MPCYHPLSAWRTEGGAILFYDKGAGSRIDLPCGRCVGCRLERSRQWATRILFEAQLHDENCFVTLTFDDAHLPNPPSLDYSVFQKFMKRLRSRLGRRVRFYMCGEYGEKFFRPHFHACLFGIGFPDRALFSRTASGFDLFRSDLLESVWPYGFSSIAELNFETAAYVARYCMKKVTGDLADEHYRYIDPDSGEVSRLASEFAHMSLKPGIGSAWFDKFRSDVYPHDFVIVNGRKCKPPRYFDKLLRRVDRECHDEIKTQREYSGYLRRDDASDARLAVREEVQIAALSRLSPRGDL